MATNLCNHLGHLWSAHCMLRLTFLRDWRRIISVYSKRSADSLRVFTFSGHLSSRWTSYLYARSWSFSMASLWGRSILENLYCCRPFTALFLHPCSYRNFRLWHIWKFQFSLRRTSCWQRSVVVSCCKWCFGWVIPCIRLCYYQVRNCSVANYNHTDNHLHDMAFLFVMALKRTF